VVRTNRRRFCRLAIGMGGAAAFGALGWGWTAAGDSEPLTRTSAALGTRVSVTVVHPRRRVAERALDAAMAEIRRIDELMSLYRPDSQLARLNRDRVVRRPHPDLVQVLRHAEQTSRETGGAFDVTVQPLWEVYAEARRSGHLPEASAVGEARRRVDWRQVRVLPERIELLGREARVTLNGIAQGYAADCAVAALRRHGIEHALVDTGEVASLGAKTRTEAWTVGIQHPRREDGYAGLAALAGRCLATSGDYATRFSEDYAHHHVFDPRTGRSPEAFASVTVAAPTACRADALSTALLVLAPAEGLRLVRSTPEVDALWIFKDGRTLATDGFPWEG
jgi:thiamine biosynthesis lipoprotein